MTKKKYQELLELLLGELGDSWRRASKTVIYRTDGHYLAQCISCQSSNFSQDYVPATFIQVLARPSKDFRFDFGGRIVMPQAGDFWLRGSIDPPVYEILRLSSDQAAVRFDRSLSLDELTRYLDQGRHASFEFSQWWSAGLVYGLCGRAEDARHSLERAKNQLEKLRSKLDTASLEKSQWLPEAIQSIEQSMSASADLERFSASCRDAAKASAARLGLRGIS